MLGLMTKVRLNTKRGAISHWRRALLACPVKVVCSRLLLNVIAIPPLVAVLRGEPLFATLGNVVDLCVLMFANGL